MYYSFLVVKMNGNFFLSRIGNVYSLCLPCDEFGQDICDHYSEKIPVFLSSALNEFYLFTIPPVPTLPTKYTNYHSLYSIVPLAFNISGDYQMP